MSNAVRSRAPELLHYRPWHGTFRPAAFGFWPIARVALGSLLNRRLFWGLYGLGMLVFLLFFVGQYLAGYPDAVSGGEGNLRRWIYRNIRFLDGTAETYRTFFFWQCNIIMVILALAGSVLVGNDIRHGSLPFYLSKPIGRWHYLAGKALAVAVVINLLTTIPAMALFLEYAVLYDWEYLFRETVLLFGVLGYGAVLTLVLSPLLLATAIWLRRTVPLVMAWTTLFVFCRLLSWALVDKLSCDRRLRLLDLWNDMYLVGNALLGVSAARVRPQPQPPWVEAAVVLAAVSLLCVSYLIYRIRGVEIVK
jgi:ABC-type transport system involved in multi-copper enzyme maturation permease subunit